MFPRLVWLPLLCASSVFALDDYLPLEEGAYQADLSALTNVAVGNYGPEREVESVEGTPTVVTPAMQIKLGMPNRTEMSLDLPLGYRNRDANGGDWTFGFGQPLLGAKKFLANHDVGVLGGILFPMGHKVIVGTSPRWGFRLGGIGSWKKKNFSVNGMATVTLTPAESDGIKPGDSWDVFVRPQYALGEFWTVYCGLAQNWTTAQTTDGKETGWFSDLSTVKPGVVWKINDEFSLEAQVPVTVVGSDPNSATVGTLVSLIAYFEP